VIKKARKLGLGVLTSEPREHGAALASFTRWASGHSRAISRGAAGSMTVTSGASDALVRAVSGPDRSDSQADSAGSISRHPLHYETPGQRAG